MNITTLYLKSLKEDAASAGLITESPDITAEERQILEQAATLAGRKDNTKNEAVTSIFSALPVETAKGSVVKGETRYFPFEAMTLGNSFFPGEKPSDGLNALKAAFENDYKKLSGADDVVAETLLHLLHKHATVIPSQVAPEISLYDYAKAKAAIAVSLAKQPEDNEQPFLLIGGDMSGIQDFIEDIISKNASKNLKGRSFYLHLLTDGIVQQLLSDTGLTQANIVYASGGSFYVLAPNTKAVKEAVQQLEKTVTSALFAEHKIQLSMLFDCLPMTKDQLHGKALGEIWSGLQDRLNARKKTKFNHIITTNFNELFQPSEVGGETLRDAITGEEILEQEFGHSSQPAYKIGNAVPEETKKEDYAKVMSGEDDSPIVKKSTQQQIIAGFFLKSKMYRVSGSEDLEISKDKFQANRKLFLPGVKKSNHILDDENHFEQGTVGSIYQKININSFNFLESGLQGAFRKGFEFYGGNGFPEIGLKEKKEQISYPKTFSEMAGMPDTDRAQDEQYTDEQLKEFDAIKFKRLGVLRMDVDGLGGVFRSGFGEGGSLAHFSALSRQLDWFFKGYLNTIWSQSSHNGFEFKDWTQIIYSGGDDLFIVGKWDCLITFAEQIKEKFKEWTCAHQGLGISGGIVFVTHKFPVMKAAELCHDEEKKAKNHKFEVRNELKWAKNAFSIFNTPLNWDVEWPIVVEIKNKLVEYTASGALPRGVLIAFQTFYEQKQDQQKHSKTEIWRWQIAYQIGRLKQRVKDDGALKFISDLDNNIRHTERDKLLKFISSLSENIFLNRYQDVPLTSKYEFFDLVNVAARWAEYELRSNANK